MAAIVLRGVTGETRADGFAVRDVDLDVPDGTVCALLGASGSGKSSLLRLVAGLDPVVRGTVALGGVDVTSARPGARDLGWVAQGGALYPHLDVRENLGFALRLRRLLRPEIDQRVRAEARAAGIEHLLGRRPRRLSAGERQVAGTAKAAAKLPQAYLLDEPLSDVDAHRRRRVRAELARVFTGLGVPALLATNDQTDALSLGTRLAVLVAGRLVQEGPTRQVYDRPATTAVAAAVGEPAMNLLEGTLEAGGRTTSVRLGDGALTAPGVPEPLRRGLDGRPVVLGVRPEHLHLGGADAPLPARVELVEDLGGVRLARLRTGTTALLVRLTRSAPARGEAVRVGADPAQVHLFDAITGEARWHADG